jgi:hypothetical protein
MTAPIEIRLGQNRTKRGGFPAVAFLATTSQRVHGTPLTFAFEVDWVSLNIDRDLGADQSRSSSPSMSTNSRSTR